MKLDKVYEEKVYAGVLGKLIGVYLGRPFEQWTHERILEELGEINYYVNEKLNVPLVVTDDDITGTFTFLRALRENNYDPNITPKQIGQSWLNNLIENKTVLWWGGRGHSAEDTAFQNLKAGIHAPMSGSIETNGEVISQEGCLSIPNIREDVYRKKEINIHFLDEQFKEQTLTLNGLAARVVQHEYDHIEGILFTDRLSPLKRRLLKGKLSNISKGNVNSDYKMRFLAKKIRK